VVESKPRKKLTDVKLLAAHLPVSGAKTRSFLMDVASGGAHRPIFRAPVPWLSRPRSNRAHFLFISRVNTRSAETGAGSERL
jgi:hypothetical protein